MDVTNCNNKSALYVRARLIVGYLAFVLIAGSLLAAPLYWLLPYIAHGPLASLLDDVPFRRVADRSFMLCALVGLYPLCRRLAFDWRDWGWGLRRSRFLMCFAIGLVCGLVSLLILVAIELYLGVLVWDNRRTAVVLVQALFSGLASLCLPHRDDPPQNSLFLLSFSRSCHDRVGWETLEPPHPHFLGLN